MKIFAYASLLAALLTQAGNGQSSKMLDLEFDLANYRYDYERNFVEVYYSLQQTRLTFLKGPTEYSASALVRTEITPHGGGDPQVRIWRVPTAVPDTAGMAHKSLVGKVDYSLEPGVYNIMMIATDEQNASITDTFRMVFESPKYPLSQAAFSDIELCSSLRQIDRDTTNIFYKNTLEAVPNPSMVYSQTVPVLMYYLELYNPPSETYEIHTEIINAYGKSLVERKKPKAGRKQGAKEATGVVEFGAIPVHTYPSNVYTLAVTLKDTTGKPLASQTKRFYIYNPGVAQDSASLLPRTAEQIMPELAGLPEMELDKEFAQAGYIADSREKEQWTMLQGSESKKRYLSKFWSIRDTDPVTPVNEARNNYLQHVRYANGEFRTAYREGWQTDRGRVFILYGKPDAVERFSSEADTRPYQIWTYDQMEGGVQFVFVDRFGFGNYELVHSTKRNELHDENWQRFVKTTD